MKIKDLVVNETCDITLVVRSATPSETKAKKPYLKLELFDGTDTINGNYWDWSSGKIPEVNTILDIRAQVTEWMGNKQLTIKSMVTNTQRALAEFAPDSGHDISAIYKEAYELMASVKDDFLRGIALHALEELQHMWLLVPGAVSVHHAYTGGTLVHSLSAAKIAAALAKVIPEANRDLCVVGAMLHDLGKLFTYRMQGISINMTDEGLLYEHSFMGAEFIGNFAEALMSDTEAGMNNIKLRLLRHIILSHHGKLEYGAAVTPKCIEAMIVNAADGLDASTEQLRAAAGKVAEDARWTQRVYSLGNSQFLTPDYVAAVMKAQPLPF